MIGSLAEQQLSPVARAEMQHLLSKENDPTLAGVSMWADEIRDTNPELGKKTGPWHYVNFNAGQCKYNPKRDCKKGNCLIAALDRYTKTLKDKKRSDVERAEALKFLVHFIGDVHQPLHNSYKTDRGGNDFQVNFNGKGSNLHRVWDTDLIEYNENRITSSGYIWPFSSKTSKPIDGIKPDYVAWSLSSCELIDSTALYPTKRAIGQEYFNQHIETIDKQIALAAQRLAGVLNYSLAR